MNMGEQLYYTSGSFAYKIDEEGRIVDNISGQCIGISNQKKKEILDDYRTISSENAELKDEISKIKLLIETHKDAVPMEIRKIIEKPPTVEELQLELSSMRNMMGEMMNMLQQKGGENKDVDCGEDMPKARSKSAGNPGSRKAIQPDECKSQ